ncbi:MAG: hypothetical protein LKE46_01670 [Clostridium sp.]|uniref:hypothetical protein n=1 Tax=Clostridium sp. TaxID=1506 RepID=UPI0025B7AC4D|nr:hypothetical protein [Clostridium sp.]MCH3962958.1 hypothetical protein [Clostridium sp.]MCI1800167.1 hypothetical protein [Clostridium sp.]MCI2200162.1 hypothetical protein [Clostridium sp.]
MSNKQDASALKIVKKVNEKYLGFIKKEGTMALTKGKDYEKGYIDALIKQNKFIKDFINEISGGLIL